MTSSYSHFRPFNLPFIAVAFVTSPFRLKKVQNTGKSIILAILHGRWNILLGALLALWLAWRLLGAILGALRLLNAL